MFKSNVFSFVIGIMFCSYCVGQTTVTCPVISDCMVMDYSPDVNHNSFGLWIGFETNPSFEERSLIQFDLSSIPSGAIIQDAEMKLTYATTQETTTFNIHRLTSSWSENTITWNTTYSYISTSYGSMTAWHTSPEIYVPLDAAVTDWIENGYNNYGVLLKWKSGSGNCNFESKETASTSGEEPSLEVTYTIPPPDITVQNPSVTPTTVCAGGTIIVSCDHYCTDGSDETPNVGYYLSTNTICTTSDIYLGDDGSTICGSDPYDGESETLTIPSETSPGTYYICFIGDYLDEVSETNENNNCEHIQITVSGTPSIAPSGASASPNNICSGNSTTLTVIGGSLGTGALWKWYSGACGGTLVGTGSTVIVNPTSTTTYYVRAEGACNSTSCANVTVNVSPNSSIESVTGTSPLCIGGTDTYTANSVELAGGTGAWSSSNTDVATVNSSGFVTTIGAGTCSITYTITGGCGGTESSSQTLIVSTNNTITLTSVEGTNSQSNCINTAITDITYATEGAVGATFTGLPSGVIGIWSANVVTISGTPTISGIYPFIVTLTGGCGNITETGTITVIQDASIGSVSGITPLCINETATYTANDVELGGGTGTWSSQNISIATVNSSGIVTGISAGSCNIFYTITDGCGGTVSSLQPVAITPNNTIEITSAAGTDNQTKCLNTAVSNIIYSTTGATGATFTGLPPGVTGAWEADLVTISGIPSLSGTFSYTVTLIGGCGNVSETGIITVIPNSSINSVTGTSPLCIDEANTYSANEVVLGGGGVGEWSSSNTNVVIVGPSGLVSAIGEGSCDIIYTITGGCGGTVSKQQLINIYPVPIGGDGATSICSNVELSYNLQTDNIDVFGNSQPSTFRWIAESNPNVTGESTALQTGGIINDKISNISGFDQTVVYNVTPTGMNGCIGNSFTVAITIKSEPFGGTATSIICSDVVLNYDLQTNNINVLGNNQPSTFSWMAESNPNVSGESTIPQITGIIDDGINNISGVDQEVFYVVVPTGINGCVGNYFSMTTTVNTIPTIVIKWSDVLICPNVNSMFSSYQWIKGTTPIAGANKQYYVTNKQPGDYLVEVIDKNGCKNSSYEISISESKSLSVYPNPATESFSISLIDEPIGTTLITIINEAGIKVKEFQTEKVNINFDNEISVSDLTEGIYYVIIFVDQSNLYYSKIIVTK